MGGVGEARGDGRWGSWVSRGRHCDGGRCARVIVVSHVDGFVSQLNRVTLSYRQDRNCRTGIVVPASYAALACIARATDAQRGTRLHNATRVLSNLLRASYPVVHRDLATVIDGIPSVLLICWSRGMFGC